MIILRWAPFPQANVASYKVYRSILGFKAPVLTLLQLNGLTLQLNINSTGVQTFTFNLTTPVVDLINTTIQGGQAYLSNDGLYFYVRDNIRQTPGTVQIVGGTALNLLGLTAHTIGQLSENFQIATVAANVDPTQIIEYDDLDGVLQDYYAVSTVDSFGNESLKTAFQQPIQSAGPLCVVEGIVVDIQGRRVPDARVVAKPLSIPFSPDGHNSNITREEVQTLSGTDGRYSLALLQGALVTLEIEAIGYSKPIQVPAQSFVFLNDLKIDLDYRFPLDANT